MPKRAFPGFQACLGMMKKSDPQRQEDGYHLLREHAASHVPDLIEALEVETEHGLRCWLLELLAEAKSPDAFPVFQAILLGDDARMRHWAAYGLRKLDSKEARGLLWREGLHRASDGG